MKTLITFFLNLFFITNIFCNQWPALRGSIQGEARKENVQELVSVAREYQDLGLEGFLGVIIFVLIKFI